jgi:hypothetical protein
MASLQNHGTEVVRVFDLKTGKLLSVRSDRAVLYRTPFSGWKVYGKVRKDLPLEEVVRFVQERPKRYREMRSIPSFETLRHWEWDGVAEALDGCTVEPDGVCPHGEPSWLRALHII